MAYLGRKGASAALTSADIPDNSITAAKIVAGAVDADIGDNAVTLAKMAGGTDGQIITYDASGDPVAVGPGSDGEVLTSTGAGSPPAFEAVPSSPAGTSSYAMSGSSTDTNVAALLAGCEITMQNTSDTDGNFAGKIQMNSSSGLSLAAIQCFAKIQGTDRYGELYFYTSNGAAPAHTMRITDGGNVDALSTFRNSQLDFAEYFEWEDGNPNDEYRAGESVVLVGNKVRTATASDDANHIIGIISETAGFVGNAGVFHWQGQFLKDDFGKKTGEINPDYDESQKYIERSERKEWAIVGLLGQIAIKKTAPKRSNWIKLRDVSNTVEQWLVR